MSDDVESTDVHHQWPLLLLPLPHAGHLHLVAADVAVGLPWGREGHVHAGHRLCQGQVFGWVFGLCTMSGVERSGG